MSFLVNEKTHKFRLKKLFVIFFLLLAFFIIGFVLYKYKLIFTEVIYENTEIVENTIEVDAKVESKKELDDWRIVLVNYDNMLPEDFTINLANIDDTRTFDARAIDDLNSMLKGLKNDNIHDIWVQSSYRSVSYQTNLFNNKINTYMKQGKSREEAERLTLKTINRPGTSEHNLGLAVDFNYVDYSFENTKAFKWLQENAKNYGFVLRYKKEKESITKVDYEPWHWRFVGKDNAIRMEEMDMCLEEYTQYLCNN